MKVAKLEYLLQKVPGDELDLFSSGLINSKKKRKVRLGKLLALLCEGISDKEEIYAELYPDKPYSEKQVRNLKSELFLLLTDFLAVRSFMKSPEKKLFVAQAMNQIQATLCYPAVMEKYARQDNSVGLSLEQAELQNRLKSEELNYLSAIKGRKELPLHELIESSEEAFVARVLYYASAHLEAQQLYQREKTKPPIRSWDFILGQLNQGAWESSDLVQVHYALFKLVKFPEEEAHFKRLKFILTTSGHLFEQGMAREIYTAALNHCVRIRNRGDSKILQEIFHLYNEMLDRNLLVEKEQMDAWSFKTIVSCAIKLGKFHWTRTFMEEYGKYVSENFRQNLLTYCRGVLEFHEGDFSSAESRMNQVLESYNDPFFGLDSRAYLLRIHFELGDVTGMEAMVNSFRQFLRRHKHLSAERLKNYQEFIRFFRRLITLPLDKPNRVARLKEEIQASTHQAGRDWLLEKIDEM